MHISERRREQIAAANRIKATRDFESVLGRCIKLRGVVADNIVLFAAHSACFDFEHQLALREAFKQLCRNIEIFLQREIAPVEHVSGKKVRTTRSAPLLRFLNKRNDKFVELVLQAMISV